MSEKNEPKNEPVPSRPVSSRGPGRFKSEAWAEHIKRYPADGTVYEWAEDDDGYRAYRGFDCEPGCDCHEWPDP